MLIRILSALATVMVLAGCTTSDRDGADGRSFSGFYLGTTAGGAFGRDGATDRPGGTGTATALPQTALPMATSGVGR